MTKRYVPKDAYVEQDGVTPVDWSRASKEELLVIERHELESELSETNPAVVKHRRLAAIDKQLWRMAEKKRAEEAAREAPWNAESRVESKLKTGGTDPGAYFSRRG